MSREVEKPERPSLPAALGGLVALVCVVRAVLGGWTLAPGAVALGVAALIAGRRKGGRVRAWGGALGVALLAGFAAATLFVLRGERLSAVLAAGRIDTWELCVLADASPTRFGWRARARATGRDAHGEEVSGDVWLSLNERVSYGEVLRVYGSFAPNDESTWGRLSRLQGVWGQLRVRSIRERHDSGGVLGIALALRKRALEAIGEGSDGRALLAGCVCGARGDLRERGLDELFSACGTAHLVAVSGGHIAIVTSLVTALGLRLGMGPRARGLLSTLLSGLFVLCCGAPASAVRSWLMALAGEGAGLFGRREHALSSVALAASLMALVDPGVCGQLGYALSVCSVVAIHVFAAYGRYALKVLDVLNVWRLPLGLRLKSLLAWLLAGARASLATSLVCQLATLSLVTSTFGSVSLVAPLSNLLVGPLFSPMVALGSLGGALAWVPGVGKACSALLLGAEALGNALVALLRLLARLPCASIGVGEPTSAVVLGVLLALCASLLYWRWPTVRRAPVLGVVGAAAALALVMVLRWRFLMPPRIVVLDVGQGDAILVQDGASAALVDTGPPGSLAAALARLHVLHLDAVVLTHLHEDHCGGMEELATSVGCENVLVGEGVAAQVEGQLEAWVKASSGGVAQELCYGDVLRVGRWRLRMLWPREPRAGDVNADSIELLAHFEGGDVSMDALLTGDAERDETAAVLAAGDVGDIDLLKVGHHGSEVSLTAAEAEALDAELAVASAGAGNAYGHPDPACVRILEEAGATFLCTMDVGDVCVEPAAEGLRVSTGHLWW